MKLNSEFYKLPIHFDVDRLRQEVSQFLETDWNAHPQGFPGNSALILISAGGGRNDEYTGQMAPTPLLDRCPYLRQVMATFDTVIGRSRLMRLEPGAEVSRHYDLHYSWYSRTRIHVPIITDPGVRFTCNDKEVHMQAGEAWIFDNWKIHNVVNQGQVRRVHLVLDTTGTSAFWDMIAKAWTPDQPDEAWSKSAKFIPYEPNQKPSLRLEKYNVVPVEPPSVINHMIGELLNDLGQFRQASPEKYELIKKVLTDFGHDWQSLWFIHGDTSDGIQAYTDLYSKTINQCKPVLGDAVLDSNGAEAFAALALWFSSAVNTKFLAENITAKEAPLLPLNELGKALFNRPTFIVSAPRSGSTMLFELLRQNSGVWSTGDESHADFESIPELNIANRNYESNSLSAWDATQRVAVQLVSAFLSKFKDSDGKVAPRPLRFLEKTPKNSLRIQFLRKVFPDALFIYLYRGPEQNISSIMDAWKSGRFVTYKLPEWAGPPWSLLLPKGWRSLNGKSLQEIAAFQWEQCNLAIMEDLADLPDDRKCLVRYEDLLSNREQELKRICQFMDVPFGPRMQELSRGDLPLSKYTLSQPDPDKWKRYAAEIEQVLPKVQYIEKKLSAF